MSNNVCISLLECRIVNRGMHIRLYTHACATAMPKRCVDWGWCVCGCHHLWNWLECPCVFLSLHLWRLGVMQVPIGNMMMVWKLKHQVVQILINPSKRKFQKWQHFPLATYEKSGLHMVLVFMTVNHKNGQVQTMEMAPNKVLPVCTRSSKTLGRAYDLDVWPQLSLMVHSRSRAQKGRCLAPGCADPV